MRRGSLSGAPAAASSAVTRVCSARRAEAAEPDRMVHPGESGVELGAQEVDPRSGGRVVRGEQLAYRAPYFDRVHRLVRGGGVRGVGAGLRAAHRVRAGTEDRNTANRSARDLPRLAGRAAARTRGGGGSVGARGPERWRRRARLGERP